MRFKVTSSRFGGDWKEYYLAPYYYGVFLCSLHHKPRKKLKMHITTLRCKKQWIHRKHDDLDLISISIFYERAEAAVSFDQMVNMYPPPSQMPRFWGTVVKMKLYAHSKTVYFNNHPMLYKMVERNTANWRKVRKIARLVLHGRDIRRLVFQRYKAWSL
ncbi:hypothetical protein L6164_023362 [Bauhinia variegata]|uniref:Uncharacterized protein n=1 Tax=Bauhinia variegata TaxID=167791 RepID=A0ACB9MJZ3_BAUVA|nr:hypothetical protein L6164_023362 [Bauhinia variegata]